MMRLAAFLWFAVVILAAGYLFLRIYDGLNFHTDLMALLPREEQNPSLQKANDAVTRALSRRIVILIGHKNRIFARAAAAKIARQLTSSGLFDMNTAAFDKDRLHRIGAFYYPYRSGLLSDEDRERLKANRGQEIADRALSQVYGVFGLANAKLLQGDPFFLMLNYLTNLPLPMSRLSLDDGLLSVQDSGMTWVLVSAQLKDEPFALDTQKQVSDVFDRAANSQRAAYPGLEILHLGAVFFAKAGAEEAMNETSAIGLTSTFGVILLMIVVFRAVRPLILSLLAVCVGVITALSASLLVFGELHVGALLFGVSLIGVCVDYSLQYCSEAFAPLSGTPQQRLRRVLAGISLGVATTVIGYLTLYLAPFPGPRQIAIFSVVGLLAAWVTVVLWLPLLDRKAPLPHGRPMLVMAEKFLAFWKLPEYRRVRSCLLGLMAVLGFVGFMRFHPDDDVHHMESLSLSLLAEQQQIQKLVGMTGSGQFFLIQVPDDETALRREEELVERLHPLVASGALSGFQSPSQYIPSSARQMDNRTLQRERLYEPLLAQQTEKLGLTETPQMPDEHGPVLTLAEARKPDTPLTFLPNLLLDNVDGGVAHVVMLDGVTHPELLAEVAEGIPGVRLVDPARDFSALLEKYRHRAMVLLGLSALLMAPLLVWRYGLHKGLWVMVPPSLAVIFAVALRGLAGGTFTFFDAMALVLVLSIGVDYAVFCAETSGDRKPVTMLAVTMAASTALMSFGLLALSRVAAVHNFGTTMTVGILLSFLFAPLACMASKEHRTLSIRNIFSIALVLILCACADRPNAATPRTVPIVPGLTLAMPNPADLGRSVEATQLVTAHYDHQTFVFEAHISATPEHFLLVGLDLMGRKIMTIDWTKNDIAYETAPWVPPQLRPENILADIVLLYWPDTVVRQALVTSSGKLKTGTHTRAITLDGKRVWQANYYSTEKDDPWSGKLHYRNLAWNYEFDVQSTETNP